MDYLIQKNILQQKNGNYGENLIVIGKFSSGKRKQRYCTPPIYSYLLRLNITEGLKKFVTLEQLKEILKLDIFEQRNILRKFMIQHVDLLEIKDNQKYLFSKCVS